MADWVELAGKGFRLLAPPPLGAPPEVQRFWQWRITAVTILNVGTIGLMFALSFGYLASIGISGFARAQSLDAIAYSQQELLNNQIDDKIWQAREKQCHADTDETRQLYRERLNDLLRQWQKANGGRTYDRLPPCSDL